MASELRITTLANNAGTESVDTTYVINGSAKFYAEHNNTMDTILKSLNASSITDHATGQCSYGMTSAMSDTVFASQVAAYNSADDFAKTKYFTARVSTTSVDFNSYDIAYQDSHGSTVVLGDLA